MYGIQLSRLVLHILMYADDTALLATIKIGIQRKIHALERYCDLNGLKVNLDKTQIVIFRRGGKIGKSEKFYYGQREIVVVEEYKYLGVIFSSRIVFRKAAEDFKRMTFSQSQGFGRFCKREKLTRLRA